LLAVAAAAAAAAVVVVVVVVVDRCHLILEQRSRSQWKKEKKVYYNTRNINVNNQPYIQQSPLITVTNGNQIGKNGIPEAELIAGSATGK